MGTARRYRAALAALAMVVLPALLGHDALAADTADVRRCNGSVRLCDVGVGDVAFPTTHNSMASGVDGFRPPNQGTTIAQQLRDGIRGFQIDAYEGFPRGDRVVTDVSGAFRDRATDLPRRLVRVAEQIHRRLGAPSPGTPSTVHLCHTFCELGAIPMREAADQMRDFLDDHPDEVLVIVIEDYVTPERIGAVFDDAGLGGELLAVTPGAPLPTLGEMIDNGTRLLVTLENGDGGPMLPNAFGTLVEETPFTFTTTQRLRGPASCAPNRGPAGAPIFQFNHWVTPQGRERSRAVNFGRLRHRVAECTEVRGRAPTLVAVDFSEISDVVDVAEALNRRAPARNSGGIGG
jgi:hypothetical protein